MAINDKLIMNRRVFLKTQLGALTAAMGIPFLESLYQNRAYANVLSGNRSLRFVTYYFPHGAIHNTDGGDKYSFFPPGGYGGLDQLGRSLIRPLDAMNLRDYTTVIKNIDCPSGGGNKHLVGISGFLTGNGISKDSVTSHTTSYDTHLQKELAADLRVKSLYMIGNPELDEPLNDRYTNELKNTLSWNGTSTTPGTWRVPTQQFGSIFDSIFQGVGGDNGPLKWSAGDRFKHSVLDSYLEAKGAVQRNINSSDKVRLDLFLEKVRSLEKKIQSAYDSEMIPVANSCDPKKSDINGIKNFNDSPTSTNKNHNLQPVVDIVRDLMALAFECDVVRIFTFQFAGEATDSLNRQVASNLYGHHSMSHHIGKRDVRNKMRAVVEWQNKTIAEFANALKNIQEADGTNALDNTVIYCGSGIHDGGHSLNNLPIYLVGKGGGAIKGGRYINGDGHHTGDLLSSIGKACGIKDYAIGASRKNPKILNLG